MPKVPAKFTPAYDAAERPYLGDLNLGNRATKFNKLTWERGCKLVAQTAAGGNRLIPELRLGHARVSSGEPIKWEDVPDPCAPGAVKKTLKRAQAMVENNQAISAYVVGNMRYVFGGDQPGHRARWDFGTWEREDGHGQLDGSRRRRTRRR